MQCQEYIVKQGDTLYSLARQNGITVEEILELNKGIEPTALAIGSVLCIPRGGAIIQDPDEDLPAGVLPPETEEFVSTYVVKEGDDIQSIAEQFGISVEQLLFANPSVNPGYIVTGTKLNIPRADVPIPGSVKYVVKAGEGLLDILKKFGIGYGRLKLFNPDTDLTRLNEGMIIFVPEVYGGSIGKCDIGSYSYTIEQGDTLDSIAAKFNLTVDQLLNMNSFNDMNNLTVGRVICLPLNRFDDSM